MQLNYTVDYQTQNAASLLNQSLLNMTKNTVDDSATIKVITIVSLIYLPGSFVAVNTPLPCFRQLPKTWHGIRTSHVECI